MHGVITKGHKAMNIKYLRWLNPNWLMTVFNDDTNIIGTCIEKRYNGFGVFWFELGQFGLSKLRINRFISLELGLLRISVSW